MTDEMTPEERRQAAQLRSIQGVLDDPTSGARAREIVTTARRELGELTAGAVSALAVLRAVADEMHQAETDAQLHGDPFLSALASPADDELVRQVHAAEQAHYQTVRDGVRQALGAGLEALADMFTPAPGQPIEPLYAEDTSDMLADIIGAMLRDALRARLPLEAYVIPPRPQIVTVTGPSWVRGADGRYYQVEPGDEAPSA